MQIDWWTLGLQTVNALVLIWILARFFFRPVSQIMSKRQSEAAAIIARAEVAKKAAEAEEEKARAEAAEFARQRGKLMDEAEKEAEKAKEALLTDARKEADKIRSDARSAAAMLDQKASGEIARAGRRLAADLAAKLLDRLPESARISAFVDGLGEGITQLPAATRRDIGKNGDRVRLKAARALDTKERKVCSTMLKKAVGHEVDFEVEPDPNLIAGLELETSHAVVRNSFRADLDHILAELNHGGR
jgi:F-type H+-transporting ATPase subunit b